MKQASLVCLSDFIMQYFTPSQTPSFDEETNLKFLCFVVFLLFQYGQELYGTYLTIQPAASFNIDPTHQRSNNQSPASDAMYRDDIIRTLALAEDGDIEMKLQHATNGNGDESNQSICGSNDNSDDSNAADTDTRFENGSFKLRTFQPDFTPTVPAVDWLMDGQSSVPIGQSNSINNITIGVLAISDEYLDHTDKDTETHSTFYMRSQRFGFGGSQPASPRRIRTRAGNLTLSPPIPAMESQALPAIPPPGPQVFHSITACTVGDEEYEAGVVRFSPEISRHAIIRRAASIGHKDFDKVYSQNADQEGTSPDSIFSRSTTSSYSRFRAEDKQQHDSQFQQTNWHLFPNHQQQNDRTETEQEKLHNQSANQTFLSHMGKTTSIPMQHSLGSHRHNGKDLSTSVTNSSSFKVSGVSRVQRATSLPRTTILSSFQNSGILQTHANIVNIEGGESTPSRSAEGHNFNAAKHSDWSTRPRIERMGSMEGQQMLNIGERFSSKHFRTTRSDSLPDGNLLDQRNINDKCNESGVITNSEVMQESGNGLFGNQISILSGFQSPLQSNISSSNSFVTKQNSTNISNCKLNRTQMVHSAKGTTRIGSLQNCSQFSSTEEPAVKSIGPTGHSLKISLSNTLKSPDDSREQNVDAASKIMDNGGKGLTSSNNLHLKSALKSTCSKVDTESHLRQAICDANSINHSKHISERASQSQFPVSTQTNLKQNWPPTPNISSAKPRPPLPPKRDDLSSKTFNCGFTNNSSTTTIPKTSNIDSNTEYSNTVDIIACDQIDVKTTDRHVNFTNSKTEGQLADKFQSNDCSSNNLPSKITSKTANIDLANATATKYQNTKIQNTTKYQNNGVVSGLQENSTNSSCEELLSKFRELELRNRKRDSGTISSDGEFSAGLPPPPLDLLTDSCDDDDVTATNSANPVINRMPFKTKNAPPTPPRKKKSEAVISQKMTNVS